MSRTVIDHASRPGILLFFILYIRTWLYFCDLCPQTPRTDKVGVLILKYIRHLVPNRIENLKTGQE
jgi:hypothetical protein